jgi:hypothetical protein
MYWKKIFFLISVNIFWRYIIITEMFDRMQNRYSKFQLTIARIISRPLSRKVARPAMLILYQLQTYCKHNWTFEIIATFWQKNSKQNIYKEGQTLCCDAVLLLELLITCHPKCHCLLLCSCQLFCFFFRSLCLCTSHIFFSWINGWLEQLIEASFSAQNEPYTRYLGYGSNSPWPQWFQVIMHYSSMGHLMCM